MLTATLPSAATGSSTGSLTRGAPGGITAVLLPPKATTRSDPAAIAGPLSASHTGAAPSSTGRDPYSFDRTTRMRGPPMVIRATWRTVWFHSVRGYLIGAKKSVSQTGCGLALQVPIHLVG